MALAALRTEPVVTDWDGWSVARAHFRGIHLDTAAAGRSSRAVLDAVAAHALREAKRGAYVAEEEVAPLIANGRAQLGELLGMPADSVVFVESASTSLTALLRTWAFEGPRTVAVAPTEWGPNLSLFSEYGFEIKGFPVDPAGRADLTGLRRMLAEKSVSLVHLTQVVSHRGLQQPVSEIARLCREVDVPLWVDAAQALGHVDTATGADAVYATSRKWLTGPRGVGVLAVDARRWDRLRVDAPTWAPNAPPVRGLESHEAHIAGRVGLCIAVAEHFHEGPERVRSRLAEVGRLTRRVFAELPEWEVGATYGDPGSITALRPINGQDVVAVRKQLLEKHGVLTTACLPMRAPLEMTFPLLRVSAHVDIQEVQLARARDALKALG